MGRFFRNPFVLGGTGLVIFYLLLYLIGPLLGFKGDIRRNVSLFVTSLAGVVLTIRWISSNWKQWRMKRAMKAGTDAQMKGASAEAKEEMAALQREFDRAFEQLSRLRPGTGIFGADGAESIPWIVIIGPPGNGKTTTLDASGLRFTKLGRKVRGISGTRNCEWWLAEEAIFLDTAGRYSTQDEDHDEWMGFLDLIRRYRKRRPIDAALLLVSLDEVMNLSPEGVEELGLQLQARLRELMDHLGVRFPVHLVFNKCDRLDGFHSFFKDLNKDERAEPWGFVLDVDTLGERLLPDVFARRLDRMVASLVERSTGRVLDQQSPGERDAALVFHQQMASCLDNLQLLTDVVFEPQRSRERPWLRSVFFCSATQDGITLPGLRHQVAESLGASPGGPGEAISPRPLFVRGVFQHLVSQAADAARPTHQTRRRELIRHGLTVAAAAMLCAVAGTVATSAYLEQSRWLDAIRSTAQALDGPPLIQQPGKVDARAVGYELGLQKRMMELLDAQDPGPLLEDAWLVSAQLLRARVDANLLLPLRATLNTALVDGSTWNPDFAPEVSARGRTKQEIQEETDRLLRTEAGKFGRGYLALKGGFVLRGDSCDGAAEDATDRWLASYLVSLWREELGDDFEKFVPGEQAKQLNRSIAFFVEGDIPSKLQADASLWQRAQEVLAERAPSEEVLFNLKIQNAGLVGLEPQLGGNVLVDIGLPEAFTFDGCEAFFKSKDEGREWWSCILNKTEVAQINSEAWYQGKHGEAWKRWLDGLYLAVEINSLKEALAVLTALGRPENSELDEVFQIMGGYARPKIAEERKGSRVRKKTWWRRLLPMRLRSCAPDDSGEPLADSEKELLTTVVPVCADAQYVFKGFQDVLKAEEGAMGEAYKAYKEALWALRDRLQRMSLSDGTDLKGMALDIIIEKQQAVGELTDVTLKRKLFLDSVSPAITVEDAQRLDLLLTRVEDQILAMLLPPAAAGLEIRWRSQVYERWNPIKPPNNSLLTPSDKCPMVMSFFDNDLANWTDQNLRPFLQEQSLDACRPKELGNTPFPLSRDACLQIRNRIRCARSAKCPEETGGGSAPDLTPYRVDAFSNECGGRAEIEIVYVDTGKEVYDCNVSRGRCVPASQSSLGTPQFRIKLKGEQMARQSDRYRASSYAALIAQGKRRRDLVYFSGIRENACTQGSLSFRLQIPLPEAGPAPPPPDPCLGTVQLPSKIVSR